MHWERRIGKRWEESKECKGTERQKEMGRGWRIEVQLRENGRVEGSGEMEKYGRVENRMEADELCGMKNGVRVQLMVEGKCRKGERREEGRRGKRMGEARQQRGKRMQERLKV